MQPEFSGVLFLIIGPSGVGKGTAIAQLKERHPEWVFPISATTRLPRPQEQEGETYFFLTHEEFDHKREKNEFIEWAWVHQKEKYGMLKSSVFPALETGKVVIREVDIQGFLQVKDHIPRKNLVSIFLLPPSQEILLTRIQTRAPLSADELSRRKESMRKELSHAEECTYQVHTEDGKKEKTVLLIEEIVKKTIEMSPHNQA